MSHLWLPSAPYVGLAPAASHQQGWQSCILLAGPQACIHRTSGGQCLSCMAQVRRAKVCKAPARPALWHLDAASQHGWLWRLGPCDSRRASQPGPGATASFLQVRQCGKLAVGRKPLAPADGSAGCELSMGAGAPTQLLSQCRTQH